MHPMLPTSDYVDLFHEFSRASQEWRSTDDQLHSEAHRFQRMSAAIGSTVLGLLHIARRVAHLAG